MILMLHTINYIQSENQMGQTIYKNPMCIVFGNGIYNKDSQIWQVSSYGNIYKSWYVPAYIRSLPDSHPIVSRRLTDKTCLLLSV